jgi:hypothetical protein
MALFGSISALEFHGRHGGRPASTGRFLEKLHRNIISRTQTGVNYSRAFAAECVQEIPA